MRTGVGMTTDVCMEHAIRVWTRHHSGRWLELVQIARNVRQLDSKGAAAAREF